MNFFEAIWALIVQLHISAFEGIFRLPVIGLILFLYLVFVDVCLIASPFVIFSGFFEDRLGAIGRGLAKLQKRIEGWLAERRAMRKAKEMLPLVNGLMPRVEACLETQDALLDLDNREYLMKRDWDGLLESVRDVFDTLDKIPEKLLGKLKGHEAISTFLERYRNHDIRERRNAEFKERELAACDAMLSDIGGKSLDAQQRDAVVTDEYSNLVIAGAGSGKTLTVVGKIKYLVERKGVRPEDILVTSFTRKSVGELAERIERAGIGGVSCRTFHQIGLGRLGKVGIANENELKRCVLGYLREGILAHPDQMSAYIEFYGCYRHLPKARSEYEQDGERLEELKAEDLTTLKGQLDVACGRLDTFQGERVKSLEELMIANFLYLRGVDYVYEGNYSGDYETEGRAYQPDFYLPAYDIYLEHFGIDEHGRTPQWSPIEEERYLEGIAWKRGIHEQNGTRLIESYSWWNKNHDLLNRLEALLRQNGVSLVEDEERLSEIYEGIGQDDRYLRLVASLVQTFLSLAKASDLDMAEIAELGRAAYAEDGYMWHRFELFMSFAEPIMEIYQRMLAEKGQVDFNDMINRAAALIAAEGMDESYRYIIVDEYQDISKSRFGLIKAVRDACGAHLMCVGDDWQAIYRFAGSDVSLFTEFGEYVGYHETMKIERTYRNSQELVDIASAFVERNPFQIRKDMVSGKHEEMPLVISYEASMAEGLETCLQNIVDTREDDSASVLVLGRHNFDIETAYPDFKGRDSYDGANVSLRRNRKTGDVAITFRGQGGITFMSVHRAKGLETDDVVVLNLRNDMYGFPNRVQDDPILQMLLGKADDYELAEERRLFYVAITRTKRNTYLVSGSMSEGAGPSPFIGELRDMRSGHIGIFENEERDNFEPALCPKCGTGRLVVRRNAATGESFLGCTNWPLCNKSYSQVDILEDKVRCPSCGGWMVRRRRKADGKPFFGCSNWPLCDRSYDIDEAPRETKPPKHSGRPDPNNSFDASTRFKGEGLEGILVSNDAEMTPAANMTFHAGDVIDHRGFGRGRVTRVDGDVLYVDFFDDNYREKKLLRHYAPIAKVGTDYSVGDEVEHKSFGWGTVTRIDGDTVFVRFERFGETKKLLKDYAPMKKIEL